METIDLKEKGCPLEKCSDSEFLLLTGGERFLVTRESYLNAITGVMLPVPPLEGNPLAGECLVRLLVGMGSDSWAANCALCGEVVGVRDQ